MTTTISLAFLWDLTKALVFPVMAILYAIFSSKINKTDKDIDEIKENQVDMDKRFIQLQASAVTQQQLAVMLQDLIKNMEKNQDGLEKRLEKTIDLNIKPLKDILTQMSSKIK